MFTKRATERARPAAAIVISVGHSAASFASAAVIQQHYGWGYGAGCPAPRGFISWSRIGAQPLAERRHLRQRRHHDGTLHPQTITTFGWKIVPVAGEARGYTRLEVTCRING